MMPAASHPHFALSFSTRELLAIAPVIDHDRLRDWQRRGVLPVDRNLVGQKGREHRWRFHDAVSIAVFAYLAAFTHLVPALENTSLVADEVFDLYRTGPDGDKCYSAPIYVLDVEEGYLEPLQDPNMKVRTFALIGASRPLALVCPGQIAIDLSTKVERCLMERAK